ncbi:FeoA family protein [Herbaspirillum sp. RTI4]|uniref:FeoA family protein n=1 Tax=Herbaspirillum sp. RTI4 TaxID=3048640 RepID=UPI002AB50113|nr:FeoA family protein [Herbaspirillum sp. RTI4]MDY7579417.1 FeoA family protein [Herbaspirillum sp. RTI4]MEA9980331.1 FeoA family protein [Herbaspirillum sp. RTI4]
MKPNLSDRLCSLKKGEQAVLAGLATPLNDEEAVLNRRLEELGFVSGETVRIVAQSFPHGDPIAVRIGNTTFALRKHESTMIKIVRDDLSPTLQTLQKIEDVLC